MSEPLRIVFKTPLVPAGSDVDFVVLLDPKDDAVKNATALLVFLERAANGESKGRSRRDVLRVVEQRVEAPLRMEYSFSLRVPDEGPVSYAGTVVNIAWCVGVELVVPMAPDPAKRAAFKVEPR